MEINIKNFLKSLEAKANIAIRNIKSYQDSEDDSELDEAKNCINDIVEDLEFVIACIED